MKLAVWRYSLPLQLEHDSVVGGGRITKNVLLALQDANVDVTIIGKVSESTQQWLEDAYIDHDPVGNDIGGYDGALVLTGPSNLLYPGMVKTYERLATLKKGAFAGYAQWDTALPFQFRPEASRAFREKCSVTGAYLERLRWRLFTQVSEQSCRASRSKVGGYATFPFKYERCLFELAEWEEPKIKVATTPLPAVGYFGSDRPGRMRELKRWFLNTGVPVDIYGKWSEKSRKELESDLVHFKGSISEELVREQLNEYALTLYMADPLYIRQDFVAQRFFENAMARVPVAYSDRLQPSVATMVGGGLQVKNPAQLRAFLDVAMAKGNRVRMVAENESYVRSYAEQMRQHGMDQVFERCFG